MRRATPVYSPFSCSPNWPVPFLCEVIEWLERQPPRRTFRTESDTECPVARCLQERTGDPTAFFSNAAARIGQVEYLRGIGAHGDPWRLMEAIDQLPTKRVSAQMTLRIARSLT
jgi:hypothetical protein